MRLDVREAAIKQPFGSVDCQLLHDVDVLTPAVIAPSRISLGVLVGQDRTLRLKDRFRDHVL
jgi:hypothetical protein